MIRTIATEFLGLTPQFLDSRQFKPEGTASIELSRACSNRWAPEHYLSGPAARSYIDASAFESANIGLEFKDYSGYPEYPQFHPPFEHAVSIVDTLFQLGPDAAGSMVRGRR